MSEEDVKVSNSWKKTIAASIIYLAVTLTPWLLYKYPLIGFFYPLILMVVLIIIITILENEN